MNKYPIYQVLAKKARLLENGKFTYSDQVEEHIETIMNTHFPNGSGFDNGCEFDFEKSNGDKLIINVPYHCMDDNGYYDGWVYPKLYVYPSLANGFNMRLNWVGYYGKYKFLLNEYMQDVLIETLEKVITYPTIDTQKD